MGIAAAMRFHPALSIDGGRKLDRIVTGTTAEPRFRAIVLAVFAAVTLALGASRIYAVVAQAAGARKHDPAIRKALGARSGPLAGTVVRRGLVPLLAGLGIGGVGVLLGGHLLARLLFGIRAADPATFTGAGLLLTAAALAANYVPARCARRVDPCDGGALRAE